MRKCHRRKRKEIKSWISHSTLFWTSGFSHALIATSVSAHKRRVALSSHLPQSTFKQTICKLQIKNKGRHCLLLGTTSAKLLGVISIYEHLLQKSGGGAVLTQAQSAAAPRSPVRSTAVLHAAPQCKPQRSRARTNGLNTMQQVQTYQVPIGWVRYGATRLFL